MKPSSQQLYKRVQDTDRMSILTVAFFIRIIVHACAGLVCVFVFVCGAGGGLFGHLVLGYLPLLKLGEVLDASKRTIGMGCCWRCRGGGRHCTQYPPGGPHFGRANLDPPPACFQLGLDHQSDRWLL